MGTDILRVDTNERVDLDDFRHAVDREVQAHGQQLGAQFLTGPTRGQKWVLSGFEIQTVDDQLSVVLGRAILATREGGQVFQGVLTSEGEATRTMDVANGLSVDGTYGIYVRFDYLDGEFAGRAFWNPAGAGTEFAQTIPTRRIANWSMRLELINPGADWLKIGEVVRASDVLDDVTDMRPFYFEGAPSDSYESGWGEDGGGVADDRNADRATYGVQNLQMFVAAVRQCLEDIKGRGLRRWWERDIGGMNIGFDANPVEGELAVGDAAFALLNDTAPTVRWDTNDTLSYDRAANELSVFLASVEKLSLTASGNALLQAGTGAGTNANGGLLQLQSGPASGNGYSSLSLMAVDKNQGSGTTARAPSEYLRMDGFYKSILGTRPLEISINEAISDAVRGVNAGAGPGVFGSSATGDGVLGQAGTSGSGVWGVTATGKGVYGAASGSGIGVKGLGTTGYGVVAESDTTSPEKSALRIVPQDTDPSSSPQAGDIFVRTVDGLLSIHNGGSWSQYVAQDFAYRFNPATAKVTGTGEQVIATPYTIGAGRARAGTTLRIKASGQWDSGLATMKLRLGGASGDVLATAVSTGNNGQWHLEAEIFVYAVGASGNFVLSGRGFTTDIATPYVAVDQISAVNFNDDLALVVTGEGGDSDTNIELHIVIVDLT